MYRVTMSDTFDLARVEGARIKLPPEYAEFDFFVHNTVEQCDDGTVLVHEEYYSVSERQSGSTIAEFEPSVAAAEATALRHITQLGPVRLRSRIDDAVQYATQQRSKREKGKPILRGGRGPHQRDVPYSKRRKARNGYPSS